MTPYSPLGGPLGMAAEVLFRVAAGVRTSLYDRNILRATEVSVPVISIGNVTVGGTGKTPVALHMTRALLGAGMVPAILSRGYGRDGGGRLEIVPVNAAVGDEDFRRWGDEPSLLRNRLPSVPIVLGGDRIRAAHIAIDQFGADVLLLDDGMQHRRIARDWEIVVIRGDAPFGNGRLLPAGPLREPPVAIRRADLILINGSCGISDPALERVKRLGGGTPYAAFDYIPEHIELPDGEWTAPRFLKGKRVFALSGLGNPDSFDTTLAGTGAQTVGRLALRDHAPFPDHTLDKASSMAKRENAIIVTTEKDAMRINALKRLDHDIHILRVDLRIQAGENHWRKLIDEITGGMDR